MGIWNTADCLDRVGDRYDDVNSWRRWSRGWTSLLNRQLVQLNRAEMIVFLVIGPCGITEHRVIGADKEPDKDARTTLEALEAQWNLPSFF